ncbi:MAG TPA: DUF5947 family protein [Fredinandcohnia sp.]|nr:DUF5947 family protein [Fredinandcohnia sp.]
MRALYALRRYARRPAPKSPRCELCAARIGDEHAHVVELGPRRIRCACPPCALLFRSPEAGGGRYRTIPDRVRIDPALRIDVARWEALGIPVRLAFLLKNRAIGKWVAVVPSPAGPVEMVLEASVEALGDSPLFEEVEDDVEALLVWGRRGDEALQCVLAPVDRCYALVGRLRTRFGGFDGAEALAEVEAFVADLLQRAQPVRRWA